MSSAKIIGLLLAMYGFQSICSSQIVINELMASNISTMINPDYSDFDAWIELYNFSEMELDIGGLYMTDDFDDPFKWPLPESTFIHPRSHCIIWADGQDFQEHASFKLSGSGEQIGLYYPDGQVIDTITFGKQRRDISFGRSTDGEPEWQYFAIPTPSQPNNSPGLTSNEQVPQPDINPGAGKYSGGVSVTLHSGPGTTIRYTTDGSIPTTSSAEYTGPVSLNATTVIRARGYHSNLLPSAVGTHSYVIGESSTLPVISLATPPDFLFDEEIGITAGLCASDEPGGPLPFDWSSNYWQRWERPVHIEYFTPEGIQGFSQDAGIAIFGGFLGRQLRQKAFTLYARNKYGDSDFDFPLFPSKPINSYKRFILRCSSNDFNRTFIRDAMMQTLVIGQMDVDYQAYQPVIVYINGKFWGLYNMREKTNQFYPEHNYGIDSDSVDLVEGGNNTTHGDGSTYLELLEFISVNDITQPENYEYVKTQMDVTEFMNYFITEIYVGNRDWLHQNIKWWREHSDEGKWRWLLYDLDWGFSGEFHWRTDDYTDNTLQWVLEHGEASLLFQKLIENEAFRLEFIQRFATHLNLTFNPERVRYTIESMAEKIETEIPRQIERWNALQSMDYWREQLDILFQFALKRPSYMAEILDVAFMMDGKTNIVLEVSSEEAGWISVFDTPCPPPAYSGFWYEGLEMKIEAHANPGWKFVRWIGAIESYEKTIELGFMGNAILHAVFEPYDVPSIVINEIHYNPSTELQGLDEDFEFLELLNSGDEVVELSGFHFTDGINFIFPQGSFINPRDYVILTGNREKYTNEGIQVYQISSGRLDNAGEELILRDAQNMVVDQVCFDDHFPWPREPDGEGPSLELIAPLLDNSLSSSWKASEQTGGTPGRGVYTAVKEAELSLHENIHLTIHPNPFHHQTNIKYSLSEECLVVIRVFNSDGQEVSLLVSNTHSPGNHELTWKPDHLPSGLYFIHVSSDRFSQSEKILYLCRD